MKKSAFFASALLSVALAPAAIADGLNPGSVLIYPFHRSMTGPSSVPTPAGTPSYFTIINVTNTNLSPTSGSTNVHYEYVNVVPDQAPGASKFKPLHCDVVDRIETLTPADTKSVLTNCHNASSGQEGYLVVTALDPDTFNTAWSHNYLIGSELVIAGGGAIYTLNALPFKALGGDGEATDADLDGELDFDDVEYEGIADELYLDSFVGSLSSIALINMTGGLKHVANLKFDVWNDNEFPLSASLAFRCWAEGLLTDISLVFDGVFLANNTPDDESELDVTCDNVNDLETGWARIRGLNASSSVESIADPAILGATSDGIFGLGGRRLWESDAKQLNGDFFKTGTDDPEN